MQYKFRGKRVDNGEWVYGFYLSTPGNFLVKDKHLISDFAGIESGEPIFDWNEVIPETVGMWTGLKDKNGIELYKDDIVHSDGGLTVFVEWNEKRGFAVGFYLKNNTAFSATLTPTTGDIIEIIGNIHDNPSLVTPADKTATI